jgi:hypothetical protein
MALAIPGPCTVFNGVGVEGVDAGHHDAGCVLTLPIQLSGPDPDACAVDLQTCCAFEGACATNLACNEWVDCASDAACPNDRLTLLSDGTYVATACTEAKCSAAPSGDPNGMALADLANCIRGLKGGHQCTW